MFAFPLISSLPLFAAVGGGVIELPAVGAFLGAVLLAALVGSALGLLRESTRPYPTSKSIAPTAVWPEDVAGDRIHREAA